MKKETIKITSETMRNILVNPKTTISMGTATLWKLKKFKRGVENHEDCLNRLLDNYTNIQIELKRLQEENEALRR